MKTNFTDRAVIGQVKDTADGYRVALSRIARAGVQDYRASELGMVGNHIVRVMRPDDQVFAKDTFASLSHAPVTIDHPAVMVDAGNWADLAVGEVGENVLRDGEWLAAPLILKDARGVKASDTTHKEISMGYTAELVDAPDGSDYDFEMHNIRFNHLALVPKGRAGSEARIGDGAVNWGAAPITTQKESPVMDMKTVVFGDQAVEVAAKDADALTKVMTDHKTAIDAKDAAIGELKGLLATAEAKILSDEAVTALVDAKVEAQTKREAVRVAYGDEAVDGASDAEIAGMFKVIDKAPAKVNDAAREALRDRKSSDKDEGWAAIMKKGK